MQLFESSIRRMYLTDYFFYPLEKSTYLQGIRNFLLILQCSGVCPTLQQESACKIASKHVGKLNLHNLMRLLLTLNIILSVYACYNLNETEHGAVMTHWIDCGIMGISVTIYIFVIGSRKMDLIEILNSILVVDQEFKQNYNINPKTKHGLITKSLVMLIVLYIGCILYFFYFTNHTLLQNVVISFDMLSFLFINGFILFISALLRILNSRFQYVNEIIEEQRQQIFIQEFVGHGIDDADDMFKTNLIFVYAMHYKLQKILRDLNKYCSLMVVISMGFQFYSLTMGFYYLFLTLLKNNTKNILFYISMFVLTHFIPLFVICHCCGKCCTEANNTSKCLAKLYIKNKENQDLIDKYLTKNIKQKVSFSAFGFYIISTATLFKIFSAVTTYLVILIQFKQLEDSKEKYMNVF